MGRIKAQVIQWQICPFLCTHWRALFLQQAQQQLYQYAVRQYLQQLQPKSKHTKQHVPLHSTTHKTTVDTGLRVVGVYFIMKVLEQACLVDNVLIKQQSVDTQGIHNLPRLSSMKGGASHNSWSPHPLAAGTDTSVLACSVIVT